MQYGSEPIFYSDQVIAVGDIHGERQKLDSLLSKILPFLKTNPHCHLVFLGDYFDRGEDSPGVLERLLALKAEYPDQVFFIHGNHELMVKTYLDGKMMWLSYVGKTFMQFQAAWGLPSVEPVVMKRAFEERGLMAFLNSLLLYYESDRVICTHAPLDYTVCMMNGLEDYEESFSDPDFIHASGRRYLLDRMAFELLWGGTPTDSTITHIKQIKKFLIAGHQVQHYPRLFKHRAFVDTGCGFGEKRKLTAVMHPGNKVFQSD